MSTSPKRIDSKKDVLYRSEKQDNSTKYGYLSSDRNEADQ
jgi:hypothetical protein